MLPVPVVTHRMDIPVLRWADGQILVEGKEDGRVLGVCGDEGELSGVVETDVYI